MATGAVMQEQRRRFLYRRQRYLCHILSDLILQAWQRQQGLGLRRSKRTVGMADLIVHAPDISPEDNAELGRAAQAITSSLTEVAALVGDSEQMRRLSLRLFVKFAGEQLSDEEFEKIILEGKQHETQAEAGGVAPTHHQHTASRGVDGQRHRAPRAVDTI